MLLSPGAILFFLLVCYHPCSAKSFQQQVDSGYANVNGTRLYYEMAGSGDVVVLIHGSFADRRHWDKQFDVLAKKFKVLRYDIRGFGKSSLPDSNTVYTDADDLHELLIYLGIRKAHLCGLSLGSTITIDFALAYPSFCNSIILAGPRVAGDGSKEFRSIYNDSVSSIVSKASQIAKTTGSGAAANYLWAGDHIMARAVPDEKTRKQLIQWAGEYSWWRYIYPNKRTQLYPQAITILKNIMVPALVITAEYDLELCKKIAELLHQQIKNSNLISIKQAGHIMNMDQPGHFNKAVIKFLESNKQK